MGGLVNPFKFLHKCQGLKQLAWSFRARITHSFDARKPKEINALRKAFQKQNVASRQDKEVIQKTQPFELSSGGRWKQWELLLHSEASGSCWPRPRARPTSTRRTSTLLLGVSLRAQPPRGAARAAHGKGHRDAPGLLYSLWWLGISDFPAFHCCFNASKFLV